MKGFYVFLVLLLWQSAVFAAAPTAIASVLHSPAQHAPAQHAPILHAADLHPIGALTRKQIRAGNIPGAVIVVGNSKRILYRRAFGYRSRHPRRVRMTTGTIFDLASLTKVVATTTAVMQLVEQGKLRLDAPVADYWPAFAANGKRAITVRQLLTHYSGLRPDLPGGDWSGYDTAMTMIVNEHPVHPPGSTYDYSDINFEVLGELVHRVTGQTLDAYCQQHIFRPLGMRHTEFDPPRSWRRRIAPTIHWHGQNIWGTVNDPTAARMGGVSGHAGLFSTAGDLAVFARMLLHGGSYRGATILQPASVALMTSPQTAADQTHQRGLGWNLDTPDKDGLITVPPGFYGHTGYTGTSLWIDPVSHTFVVILTNRVYPNDTGNVEPLRRAVAGVVTAALDRASALARRGLKRPPKIAEDDVLSGLDVLAAEQFAPLAGKRAGLITNQSGLDRRGRSAIELLRKAPNVKLVALFSPEHGLYGNADTKVTSSVDPTTGLPVYSLYGSTRRPTPAMLHGIDALVFDIQDAGARFYTYITTLAYCMQAAAAAGIDFYVLDRPDPIDASQVQGPVLDDDLRSFTGYFPLPIRYGMTPGELALLYNDENHIGAKLHIIKMRGYSRASWFDQTGLPWVNPSPNLRSVTQTALYPGVGLVEGANVSVGRGTPWPFQVFGAPWIDGKKLAAYLQHRHIAGVRFEATTFTPNASAYRDQECHGVRVILRNRNALDAPALGIEIASALHHFYPHTFDLDKTLGMIGARSVVDAIGDGKDPRLIVSQWQDPLKGFKRMRLKYLLY